MRILYFSNIPINHEALTGKEGGGWITSLLVEMAKSNHDVAVGYLGFSNNKETFNNITVYNICANTGGSIIKRIIKLYRLFSKNYLQAEKNTWDTYRNKLLEVVADFKPDIIHVFGSEKQYGLLAGMTEVPLVLHIQGYLNPCHNALLPPFLSWNDYIGYSGLRTSFYLRMERRLWEQRVFREREILSHVDYFIGRTDWDEHITNIFRPNAYYFYGNEILRDVFYNDCVRQLPQNLTIVSTISSPPYKGFDVILKSAYILKYFLKINFVWKVFGKVNPYIMEKVTSIDYKDVNINLMGLADSETLKDALLNSTVYIHPSYIDNSPNSVCEAQILGVTSIACNVGGLSSIIKNEETGILVPANDPYQIAWYTANLFINHAANIKIGEKSRKIALIRHDKQTIINDLEKIYDTMLKQNSKTSI